MIKKIMVCEVCGKKQDLADTYRQPWFIETICHTICSRKCFEKDLEKELGKKEPNLDP